MITVLAFIFVISLLILVHEFGHFIMARLFRVKVLSFALGYGPKIWAIQRGDTEFSIRVLPLGGYVRMAGMEGNPIEGYGEAEFSPEERFDRKPLWQRSLIVVAGPAMNFLLAIFLVSLVFGTAGAPTGNLMVSEVMPGGPAEKAGVQKNDVLIAINGKPINDLEEVVKIISTSNGRSITLTIRRNTQELNVRVTPEWNEAEKRALIKVVFGRENQKLNLFQALSRGTRTAITWFVLSVVGLLYTIMGKIPFEATGPLGIAQMAGQAASFGFLNLLLFAAVISVFLSIFNLIPIPVLDGGHLLLFLYEKIRKKPLEPEKVGFVYFIGIVFIFLLAIFVTYQDVMRMVTGK
ncbi:MAG: RIP metalloprotease RseP [Atribacterota bacterium]